MKKLKNIWKSIEASKKTHDFLIGVEKNLAIVILGLLALLPVLEVFLRKFFRTGIHSSSLYMQHMVLWITFICGMITAKEGQHLSLSAGINLIKEPLQSWIKTGTSFFSVFISFALFICSLSFTFIGFDPAEKIGIFPIQFMLIIMPVAFLVMSIRFILLSPKGRSYKIIAGAGLLLALCMSFTPLNTVLRYFLTDVMGASTAFLDKFDSLAVHLETLSGILIKTLSLPLILLLIASALLGTPIFVVLGGLAVLFFMRVSGSLEVIPNEAYAMLTGPIIPAIPLFTLAGFILSESKAGHRLVEVFRAFFGWLPGGMSIIAVFVCAFFTTFTGASGVTILALGGLLSYMLVENGYPKKFTTGLLTASGSIGLLFPPSLPIIMYAVTAQIHIVKMFVGGFIPGLVMILVLIGMGVRSALKSKVKRYPFNSQGLNKPFKAAFGEILLPVIIIVSYFGGLTTLVETSAITVLYVLILEAFIHKDIKIKELSQVFYKAIPLIGGVLTILALAKGFSYYIIDSQIPMKLTEWCQAHIESKYVFLILLNIGLLITGCFMDIFSAIIVVVPLIIPLGNAYGIDPIHLGVIFLANLELGYLTPPVGLNLFLSSYRFGEPLVKIYRFVVPFLLLLLISVLLITYIPWISTFLVNVIKF